MWNASKNLMILLTEILKALRKEVSVNSMKKQKKKSEFFLNQEKTSIGSTKNYFLFTYQYPTNAYPIS